MENRDEEKLILAKLNDKIRFCKTRNKIVNTEFLNLYQKQIIQKRLNELKVGDKIVTHSGIYGEIASMRETTAGKIFVIKTGADEDAKKASYLTINAYMVAGIDEKQDVVLDAEGNVIEPEDQQKLKEEVLKEKAEKEPEENKEENKEEKPKKKTTKKSNKKAEPAAPKAEPATADKAN